MSRMDILPGDRCTRLIPIANLGPIWRQTGVNKKVNIAEMTACLRQGGVMEMGMTA